MFKMGHVMKNEVPKGFTLHRLEGYSIVLRDDFRKSCCDLVVELAKKPALGRGKICVVPFSGSGGDKILVAFRKTVRGGPYGRLGIESTMGLYPRTFLELNVAVAAEAGGAPVASPAGCYWKWGLGGIGYTGGYFSIFQEKAHCLGEELENWELTNPTLLKRRETLSHLGKALKKLHQCGVIHTDLTLRNVLVQPDGRCSFVDLDGAFVVKTVCNRSRISALSRLNRSLEKLRMGNLVPLRERLWFIREYSRVHRYDKAFMRCLLKKASLELRLHRLFWSR